MAFFSLKAAKLRSFLTMLGIIIGVAAVVSILAIGAGVKQAVESQITGVVNANAIAITSGKIEPGSAGPSPAAAAGASTLTEADVEAIAKVRGVTAVAPIGLLSGAIGANGTPSPGTTLLATTGDFAKTQSLDLAEGRFLQTSDTDQYHAVLGGEAKRALFGDTPALGKTVTIRGAEFEVVGSLKVPESSAASGLAGGSGFDNAAYLPFSTAKTITGGTAQIMRILAQTDSTSAVPTIAEDIRSTLRGTHAGEDDFTVLTQKDILATVDTVLSLLTTFIVAIASISLLVGGIGIMNIMLVNVTERTREIGLRKAIGASSTSVLSQFLIEAVVISVIGGALGILAALGMATIAGHLANITPVFTPQSIFLAVGVSAGVGILFGIAPAIKAARKRPILALKSAE